MLHFSTVSPNLLSTLKILMVSEIFNPFRLVGGTALSLQLGHRISIDIDLFSDAAYGSIDFKIIEDFLQNKFQYTSFNFEKVGFGKTYFIGSDKDNCVKLDLYYSDPFIDKIQIFSYLRMASLEEIIAMKVEVIQNGGRKKDFWDLHELLQDYTIDNMLDYHKKRYPYNHDRNLILKNFTNFAFADLDFDVICLKGKHWETIKNDFQKIIKNHKIL